MKWCHAVRVGEGVETLRDIPSTVRFMYCTVHCLSCYLVCLRFRVTKSVTLWITVVGNCLSTNYLTNSPNLNLLKPTGHVMHQQFNIQQLYVLPTLYLCVLYLSENTATCATYSINWLVFITEMKSVYSAVRTGSLNTAVCASSLKG